MVNKLFGLGLLVGLVSAVAPPVPAADRVQVGVVVDGFWEGNERVRAQTVAEVRALTGRDFDVVFPDEHYLVGDWTLETARRNLERLLADPEVDLVITWGILSSHAICCRESLPKPVIAPTVLDAALQGLPREDGASGVRNLNYVALPNTLASELAFFQRMVPFRRVAILTNRAFSEGIPELEERTREIIEGSGLEFEYIPVGDSVPETLAAIPEATDVVFVYPLFQLSSEQRAELIAGLNRRRLPSFSALGAGDVEAGMLASLGSPDFFPRLVRRVALNIHRILLGEDAGSLPVSFELRDELTINMATAREIGVSPSWEVLIEARLLHEESDEGREELTLAETVRLAVEANLDLAAEGRAVAAGAQEVARGRSILMPRLGLSATGLLIDDDRAAASFGSQAERSVTGALALEQIVYSEPALANLEVQRQLQAARELDLETLRLDIVLEAAVTYLNLLRVESLARIQRNNLEVTRSNFELATIRRTIGAANPAEVYRWESQIASDRKALIEARARERVAAIAVNRLLHRELERPFATVEVGLDDPSLITSRDRFGDYIGTPRRFDSFREFVAREGLRAAPEVRRLDALVAAGERALQSARRAYWTPALGLQARLEEALSESGAGSEAGFSLPLPGLDLPSADERSWSLGLSASLPLYAGGGRAADRIQAEEELDRLRLLRDSVAEKVEQRIRTAMEIARASFAGIELSRQAAAAARKNLELVSDAYARGAVSIIELLDAQNAALNADQLASNSVYDFLIDLTEAQRSACRFGFFLTPEERDAWFLRLDRFLAEAGVPPLQP